MSDAADNFVSDKFKEFCRNLSMKQAVSSSYHHHNNDQVKVCIRLIKQTLKKCFETTNETYVGLLWIR